MTYQKKKMPKFQIRLVKIGDQIRFIISMDVGDGELASSWAELRNSDGTWVDKCEINSLQTGNLAPKCMATIWYHDGIMDVGKEGGEGGVLCVNFKRPPSEWDEDCCTVDGVKKAYKDVMADFIGKSFAGILSPNVNPQLKNNPKEQIALFVGCPSSPQWTDPENIQAYEKLIQDATGVAEVHVIPESTAAVFSAVSKAQTMKWTIHPENGVLVLDLGSLTADATYLLLGKELIELSWTLGASAVETNILQKIMNMKKNENAAKEIGSDGMASLRLQCRKNIKEAWFGDGTKCPIKEQVEGKKAQSMTLNYVPVDENGHPVCKEENGKRYLETKHMMFHLSHGFMKDVIETMKISNVTWNKRKCKAGSWKNLCGRFIAQCQVLLSEKKLPCQTVIVTGGASRMDFVMDLVKDVFRNEIQNDGLQVYRDQSPSFCVCHGLCQAAFNYARLPQLIKDEQSRVKKAMDDYAEIYRDGVRDSLTTFIYEGILQILKNNINGLTVKELQEQTTDYFQEYFKKNNAVRHLLLEPERTFRTKLQNEITTSARNAAASIYPEGLEEIYIPNNNYIGRISADLGGMVKGDQVIDPESFLTTVQKIAINVAAFIAGMVAVIAVLILAPELFFLAPLAGYLTVCYAKYVIAHNPDHRITHIPTAIENLQNDKKEEVCQQIEENASNQMADAILQERFGEDRKSLHETAERLTEEAIRIVALEQFENFEGL